MDEQAMEALLERAAESGARRALERVGLHDDKAFKDVNDLRDLLEMWRQIRTGALRTLGKMIALGLLALIAFLTGKHYWPGS